MDQAMIVSIILKTGRFIPGIIRIWIFAVLFNLFYHISTKHRMITLHNLRCAFPEKNMEEIQKIAKGSYRNLAILAAEFFDIPYLTRDNIYKIVTVEGLENCTRALEKDKGVLLFSAHFCNWELCAAAFSLIVKPATFVYRPLDSPLLDEMVKRVRSATGNIPLTAVNAMRPMIRSLRKNGIIGLLIDQNMAWQEGVFVNFFGRPACTTDGLSLLALHTEAAVIPVYLIRESYRKYRLVLGEEIKLVHTEDGSADIISNTELFTSKIEDVVRKYPEQWLWIHQRWKTKLCQVVKS